MINGVSIDSIAGGGAAAGDDPVVSDGEVEKYNVETGRVGGVVVASNHVHVAA